MGNDKHIDIDDLYIENHGPAVNVLFKYKDPDVLAAIKHPLFTTNQLSEDKKSVVISIDITLAIEIARQENEAWPLEGFCEQCGGIKPTDEAKVELSRFTNLEVKHCHLVAKGGYWNISFANIESDILNSLDEQHKVCLRAIKV